MADANIGEVLDFRLRGRGVSDEATEPEREVGEGTDELRAHAPTLGDSVRLFETASPQHSGSFEHRRIVETAKQRLFGRGQKPRIGRFQIERRLGIGGMGEVYLAHDDELERKVAVKRVIGAITSERDRERLRREARALARLSHANVVQIYEVGEHEQCTFLAMEYVDGQTLGEWLAAAPRHWRDVLAHFIAAGRGLAAAHEAGLVHRDFKPDNVLLSSDGAVRVADFGLALAGSDDAAEPTTNHDVDSRLSTAGSIRGTIRYMPLEQLRGETVDARSDQFSYCVALYEALYGAPPFSLASTLDRYRDLEHGVPLPPNVRGGARPPARLWRLIRRGLSRQPADRWPDMPSLLAALDDVTRRRRRLAWIGSVSAALVLAAAVMLATAEPEPDPCAGVAHELDGVWDADVRAALDHSAAAVAAEHAADSRERIFAGLDRWATAWVGEREGICRATSEQRIEPELGRQQSACLTRQRAQVEDLVGLLLEPGLDGDALAGAVEAVAELPSASACADDLALLGVTPPADDIRDRVEGLRRDVVRAAELRVLGRVEQGRELAAQVERDARALGYGPLLAEALAELAKAELDAGSLQSGVERMHEAIDEAERHRLDHVAADLWTDVALRTLTELDDADDGEQWLRRAAVANDRINAPARARARLDYARGRLAELRGDKVGAELGYRAAIAKAEAVEDSMPELPTYLACLARAVAPRDRDEAISLSRSALAHAERTFGAAHPQTAIRMYDLAILLGAGTPGQPEAERQLANAARIWTASHMRPHRELAKAELLLGKIALQHGQLHEAEAHAMLLVSIQADSLPIGHRDHGAAAHLLATVYGVRGQHEQALEQVRVALGYWEPAYGSSDAGVLRLHSDAAANLLALGRLDQAEHEIDGLLGRVVDQPQLAVPVYLGLAELHVRRGRLDAADEQLRAIELLPPETLGGYAFSYELLRALVEARRGQTQPDTLARLQRARMATPFSDDQVAAWLVQIGLTDSEYHDLGLR